MSAASLRARYVGATVTTASPERLLVMLYDRLALDLDRAQTALAARDRQEAGEQLQHAQEIVLELLSSLKVDAWDGGPRLAALYKWLLSEMVAANVKADVNRVRSCLQVVEPLRDAWHQAAASLATTSA
jgi:flagellar protein FliS